jgi:hypothetical protein
MPWRDSISRLIAPVSSEAGGDDATRPQNQGVIKNWYLVSGLGRAL